MEEGELRELIKYCTSFDPKDRPYARELMKHPYFESLRVVGGRVQL